MGAVNNREVTRNLIQESRVLKAQLQMVRTDVQWLVEQQQELRARATGLARFTDMMRASGIVPPTDQAGPARLVRSKPGE